MTNLRIMLAFRDGLRSGPPPKTPPLAVGADSMAAGADAIVAMNSTEDASRGRDGSNAAEERDWDGEGFDGAAVGAAFRSMDWGGGGDGGLGRAASSPIVVTVTTEQLRPGILVEAAAGIGLVGTFALMALDSRLIPDPAIIDGSAIDAAALASFRDAADAVSRALSPSWLPPAPANALSVPTWGVHVFSLVEWLVAMGLVWDYADVSGEPGWRKVRLVPIRPRSRVDRRFLRSSVRPLPVRPTPFVRAVNAVS